MNQVIRFTLDDDAFAIWTNPWIDVSLANLIRFSTSLIFVQYLEMNYTTLLKRKQDYLGITNLRLQLVNKPAINIVLTLVFKS